MASNQKAYSHYYKHVAGLEYIDVYRVIQLFGVADPCLQHAIKKLLVVGGRGAKDAEKDVAEAIVSLQRWQEMRAEERVFCVGEKEVRTCPGPEVRDGD